MSKKSYAQTQRQIEALQREADGLRAQEVAGVIACIKEAIAELQPVVEDLHRLAREAIAQKKSLYLWGSL